MFSIPCFYILKVPSLVYLLTLCVFFKRNGRTDARGDDKSAIFEMTGLVSEGLRRLIVFLLLQVFWEI